MAKKKTSPDEALPAGDDPRHRLRQLRAVFNQAVKRLEAIPESEVSEAGEPFVKECAEAVGAFALWFAELTPDNMCMMGDAWRVASALVGLAGVVDWIGLHWSVPFAHEIEADATALLAEAEALDAAVTKAFTVERTPNRLFMERRPLSEADHDAIGEGIEKVALLAEALGGRLLRTAAWVSSHPASVHPAPRHGRNPTPAEAGSAPTPTKPSVPAADGEDAPEQPPALTQAEQLALRSLAGFDPSILASVRQIVEAMDPAEAVSERTVTPALRKLVELDLAERPEGERRGTRLTLKGRRLAAKMPKIAD